MESCGQEGNWVKLTPAYHLAGTDPRTGAWMASALLASNLRCV